EFRQYDYFVRSVSQQQNTTFQLNYIHRVDKLPISNSLKDFSKASTYNARLELNRNGRSPLSISSTYRTIEYLGETNNQNEETLLSRFEYNLNTLKNAMNLSTFYEHGTGQEPKREFIYLEVP